VADKVVAGSDALGNSVCDDTASLHDSSRTPRVRSSHTAFFLDLEPNRSKDTQLNLFVWGAESLLRPGHPLVTPTIWTLGHVRNCRADMAIRPQSPVELDIRTSSNLGMESGR
jgi:hypothetical protein